MERWYVYILASQRNGTLYIGITNSLARRIDEHRAGVISAFTSKYRVHSLVYYESYGHPDEAIRREKNMKAWKRIWKLKLVESLNPTWEDLSQGLLD